MTPTWDAPLRASDPAAAQQAWLECIALSEGLAKRGQRSGLVLHILCHRGLAEHLATRADRPNALRHAQRTLELANQALSGPSGIVTFPRGYSAMARTYAALARSSAAEPDDRAKAREYFLKTLDAWRKAEKDPAFGTPHRREIAETEAALR